MALNTPRRRYGHTPRSRATAVGTPLIGHWKLLPTVTNFQPCAVRRSMITPLAATRMQACESFAGQIVDAYLWFTVESVTTAGHPITPVDSFRRDRGSAELRDG